MSRGAERGREMGKTEEHVPTDSIEVTGLRHEPAPVQGQQNDQRGGVLHGRGQW